MSNRPKPSPTAIRDSQDVGMKVTETTVWYRGKSKTFTAQETTAGAGYKWLADQKKQERS